MLGYAALATQIDAAPTREGVERSVTAVVAVRRELEEMQLRTNPNDRDARFGSFRTSLDPRFFQDGG